MSNKILDTFNSMRMNAGFPLEMALFSRSNTLTPDFLTIYFTPAAAEVAKVFNASPCIKPSVSSAGPIGQLAGDQKALHVFFPEMAI
jgi:hypothetical protein